MAEAISRHGLDQSANRLSQPVGLGLVTAQAVLAEAGAVVTGLPEMARAYIKAIRET